MSNTLTALTHPIFEDMLIGTGTWAWGDRIFWGYGQEYHDEEIQGAFDACIHNDICFFDTAEVYGQGKSEELLGLFMSQAGKQVKISTKFMPFPWRLNRGSLLNALKGSLNRLGRNEVDLYQIQMPLPPVTIETWMEALAEAVQAGLTRAVGVSNFNGHQLEKAQAVLIREGIQLASNQVEYNLLNREAEFNGLIEQCQALGVKVIAYSPLALGLLSGKYTPENPPKGLRYRRYGREDLETIQPLIQKLNQLGIAHGDKTPAQVALNWVICKGALPIPGAKNASQVVQNAGAVGWNLEEDEIGALDEISGWIKEKYK